MAMAYVRSMRACQTPTSLTQGGERMGDYVEGPFGHTQTYPLCTAQVALENRATVFLILYLQRLSVMSHSRGIHSELYRLLLRCGMNLLVHLHYALKA